MAFTDQCAPSAPRTVSPAEHLLETTRDIQAAVNSAWRCHGRVDLSATNPDLSDSIKTAIGLSVPGLTHAERALFDRMHLSVYYGLSGLTTQNQRAHTRDASGQPLPYSDTLYLSFPLTGKYAVRDTAIEEAILAKLEATFHNSKRVEYGDRAPSLGIPVTALQERFSTLNLGKHTAQAATNTATGLSY